MSQISSVLQSNIDKFIKGLVSSRELAGLQIITSDLLCITTFGRSTVFNLFLGRCFDKYIDFNNNLSLSQYRDESRALITLFGENIINLICFVYDDQPKEEDVDCDDGQTVGESSAQSILPAVVQQYFLCVIFNKDITDTIIDRYFIFSDSLF